MAKENNTFLKTACFLLGATTGILTTLLFATRGGKVFRRILINDTDMIWDNVEEKGWQFIESVDMNIRHIYKKAIRSIDTEVRSVKAGIDAAMKTIKGKNTSHNFIEDVTEDFIVDEERSESESLPKREGMRRRSDHKRFT